MAKITTILSNTTEVVHNNTQGLNDGDYIHLTQLEKEKFDGIEEGAEVNVNSDWNSISGDSEILNKPLSFPPSSHIHSISDVINLQSELDSKVESVNGINIVNVDNTDNNNPIINVSGTKSQFNTAVTDGDILYVGDITQYTDELAQNAVGNILVDSTTIDFSYDDISNVITADVKANSITSTQLVDNINISEFVNNSGYLVPIDIAGKVPYTGSTTNVDLGEYQLKTGQLELDQTPTGIFGVGKVRWNDSDGTAEIMLKGGNVTLQVGQEQVIRVVNKTGVNLLESNYSCVYTSGAQGQRLKIDLANANTIPTSNKTIGLVTENINNNQEGFITTTGLVRTINTTGNLQGETWLDGDILYLSPITPGALTNIIPTSLFRKIVVGYVINSHLTQGSIFVKISNGVSMDEIHDVEITGTTINKVIGSTTEGLWENKTIPTILGYIPEDVSNKATNFTTVNNTLYPSVQAVKNELDLKVPTTYSKIVYVNATSPTTATIFDLNNPPLTNDNSLKIDVNNLYIGTDASTWVYITSPAGYVTKVVPATSNFFISETTTDAGNSKTVDISRSGSYSTPSLKGTVTFKNTSNATTLEIKANSVVSNILIGTGTGNNVTGIRNTAIGQQAIEANTSGSNNTGLGEMVLRNNIIGTGNTAVGMQAARFYTGNLNLTNVTDGVFVGLQTKALADNSTNEIVIGNNATGLGSNTTTIGKAATVFGRWWGNLLLGTSVNGGFGFENAGTTKLTSTVTLGTQPTTSAGTYDILTRNMTTGLVEKVVSGYYATSASPTFTGTPSAPTATLGTNTTQLATTAFVLANAGGGGGSGDMVLASAQTNTGVKTFLDGTIGLRNVANTFTSFFTNTNTASRTYTLQNKTGLIAQTDDYAFRPLDEGSGIGYVINGRIDANYGSVGLQAVDLGFSESASTTRGATGNYSVVSGGQRNRASGMHSNVGGGADNVASNSFSSVGGGYGNTASGINSAVIGGDSNQATAQYAFVSGGTANIASGVSSYVSGGESNRARSYGEWVGGFFGTDYTPLSTTAFNALDRLFNIGNGTSSVRSNALTILKNGLGTLPSVTNALISAEATGKAIVTKSWVPEQLKDFYSDVNNVSTTETDLLTYTTVANRLNANGEKIISNFSGTFNDVTASSQLKLYFAGTLIGDTGTLTMSVTGAWVTNVSIIRTGTTTARAVVNISTPSASTASYTKYTSLTGLTFTGTNIIKITATASGATGGNDDITATYGNIIWQPASL